jgi:uncharacterized protein with HEPN domain
MNLDDLARAKHILDAINYIEQFVEGFDLEHFEKDILVKSATERQLTIVGEASNHLTEEIKAQFPDINWRGIRAFRNVVIHEYFGSSVNIIWTVILQELPKLKIVIQQIINQLENEAT